MKKIITTVLAIPLIIGILIGLYYSIFVFDDSSQVRIINKNVFADLQPKHVKVTEFFVYGTSLNITGTLENINKDNIESARLIITDGMYETSNFKLEYTVKDNIFQFTTESVNEGVNLEKLENGEYFVLLRFKFNNNNSHKFYALENVSEYKPIDYYTITKDGKNQRIDIGFDKREYKKQSIDYMYISKKDFELPENIYDFVIDPGHGGKDSGEKKGEHTEKDIALDVAKKLYDKLTSKGYKVFITRDGVNDGNISSTTMYDQDGRINKSCRTKAKYMISLHINDGAKNASGLEVYAPSKINLNLASKLSKKIVDSTELEYSNSKTYKKSDGVYVHNFNKMTMDAFIKSCENKGFTPYNIDTETQYLYTIREVGGIAQRAYVDGRNIQYGTNNYWNANYGIECYQIEMGYINTDLEKILNSKDGIAEAITCALVEHINN